ncbi:MAG TPA: methyltransferase domain-containing protein [Bacteroidia bacterium]|jgi:SAM-dependent methyltransferase|nr:methyltransferase domain-containing protein [Bacteroidia bacterium]
MFFPERIKQIQPGDQVLEIGPGAHPYHRSNVLLELSYEKEEERHAQFGHSGSLETDKKVVFYDGGKFPFEDHAFDYVICSHVLEHVENVEGFLSEIFRVAGKGYMEYPLAYYDYLYNFGVHVNFLKYDQHTLHYLKKKETNLDAFKPIQEFLLDSLNKGHATLIEKLLPQFMEGFEWNKPFSVVQTHTLTDVLWKQYEIPTFTAGGVPEQGIRSQVKAILKKILHRQ